MVIIYKVARSFSDLHNAYHFIFISDLFYYFFLMFFCQNTKTVGHANRIVKKRPIKTPEIKKKSHRTVTISRYQTYIRGNPVLITRSGQQLYHLITNTLTSGTTLQRLD